MTTLRVAVLCVAAGGALSGQSYYGSITSAGCSGIYGWAWNSASPQTSVDVALYNGTAYLGSWPASAYSAPNGNNYSGFTIPIPSALQDNQVHALTVSYGAAQTNGTQINIPIGNSTTQFTTTIQCAPTSSGYQYYFTDPFQTISTTNWIQNGSLSAATGEGLVTQTSGNGSLISNLNNVPVQGPNANNYEVSSDVVLQAGGGDYVQYLRASTNALSDGSTGQGSYIAVELQNPTFNATTGACSAYLAVYQFASSVIQSSTSTPIKCQTRMTIRSVVFGNSLNVMVNGLVYSYANVGPATGAPGVGGRSMPNGNSIAIAKLGPWDNVAPAEVNANTFTTSVYFGPTSGQPGSVMAQWQGAVDNPAGGSNPGDGVGVAYYTIARGTTSGTDTTPQSFISFDASVYDGTVYQSNTYVYSITPCDFHGNCGPTLSDLFVSTGQGTVDGRRTWHTPDRKLLGRRRGANRSAQRQPQLLPSAHRGGGSLRPESQFCLGLQFPKLARGRQLDCHGAPHPGR